MLNKLPVIAVLMSIGIAPLGVNALEHGKGLCNSPGYSCLKVPSGGSWQSMFPNSATRMVVEKVNRMNTPLHAGMMIAVPNDVEHVNILQLSPLPQQGAASSVRVDLSDLAWGAYDSKGELVNWGPISGGKGYCPDTGHGCKTVTGDFTFYRKQGSGCVSSRFPLPNGGAPMPYCMHFHGGFAMHASTTVPGYNASHGCVRMFFEDAKWLNQNFVDVGATHVRITP
jgi:hypothetical protein